MEEEGNVSAEGTFHRALKDGLFPSRARTGSGYIGQHEEAHTGVKSHSTSGKMRQLIHKRKQQSGMKH